jgi:hypothetical protein
MEVLADYPPLLIYYPYLIGIKANSFVSLTLLDFNAN